MLRCALLGKDNSLLKPQRTLFRSSCSLVTQEPLAFGNGATTLKIQYPLARAGKLLDACNRSGSYIGICGQGPSDHPDLAEWLLDQGIESVSLNPDTVVETWMMLAKHAAEAH